MDESYDVVVIGGAASGLSAAVALARSRRSVLVLDAGDPRNAPAAHVHNFLSRDALSPSELYAVGRTELEAYGARVKRARVKAVHRDGDLLLVITNEQQIRARRVVVATGLRDELPDIPGLASRWGIDVLHCPYCHGWEVRDKRLGILATGPMAVFQTLLFRQLSPHVTLLQHSGPRLTEDEHEQFDALDVQVVDGVVTQIQSGLTGLTGVQLVDGSRIDLEVLIVTPLVNARAEMLASLGLEPTEVLIGEHVIGTQIDATAEGATAVPGIWAAGNVADLRATVVSAAAAGLTAAGAVNGDLVEEDARRAVENHRRHQGQ